MDKVRSLERLDTPHQALRGWPIILLACLFCWAPRSYANQPGAVDLDFKLNFEAPRFVRNLAVQKDGKILMGAVDFNSSLDRNTLVRLLEDGSLDRSFQVRTDEPSNQHVLELFPDGKILLAGKFTVVNWEPRSQVAKLNVDGSLDAAFKPSGLPEFSVLTDAAVYPDGKVILAGFNNDSHSQGRFPLYRLSTDGSLDRSFDTGSGGDNFIRTVALQSDGKVIVGGLFQKFAGVNRAGLARLFPDGSLDREFDPKLSQGSLFAADVLDLQVRPDDFILVGGSFPNVNRIERRNIALLRPDGSLENSFDGQAGPDGLVRMVRFDREGSVFVAGSFSRFNHVARAGVARLLPDGCLDASFDPGTGSEVEFQLEALAVEADGDLLVGGHFEKFNGVGRPKMVRLHRGRSEPSPPSIVRGPESVAVVQGGDAVLSADIISCLPASLQWQKDGTNLAGSTRSSLSLKNIQFNHEGNYWLVASNPAGAATSRVAQISVVRAQPGLLDPTLPTGHPFTGAIYAAALQTDGRLLAGGSFTNVQGAAHGGLARWTGAGQLDSSFRFAPGIGGPTNRLVAAIVVQPDEKILLGGLFDSVHGIPRRHIARLNPDGSLDQSFNPPTGGADRWVRSLLVLAEGKILVAGDFTTISGAARMGLARLNSDGSLDPSFDPPLLPGSSSFFSGNFWSVRSLILQPDGKILVGGHIGARGGGFNPSGVFRLHASGTLDNSFHAPLSLQDPSGPRSPAINQYPPRIQALALQPDGKVVVGGLFNRVGSVRRNWLARLESNGALDPTFNASTHFIRDRGSSSLDLSIDAITVQEDGKIVVGGKFDGLDRYFWPRLARLNANGYPDFTFQVQSGPNAPVLALLPEAGGKLVIGGKFSTYQNVPRAGLARIHAAETTPGNPAIMIEPPDRLLIAGQRAALNVFALGTALRYQWHRNDLILDGQTNNALLFGNPSLTDAGIYHVTISSPLGRAESRQAIVRVLDLDQALDTPEMIWRTGGQGLWTAQTNVTFDGMDAAVSERAPQVSFERPEAWIETTLTGPGTLTFWQHIPNVPIAIQIFVDRKLQAAHPDDLRMGWRQRALSVPPGQHTVRLSYLINEEAAYIDQVRFAPEQAAAPAAIIGPPEGTILMAGEKARFQVHATGSEPIHFQWFKDRQRLPGATNAVLELAGSSIFDAGHYSVLVSNSWGQATSAEANLAVHLAPQIQIPPENAVIEFGRIARFTVTAVGSPPPSYQWRFNGQPLPAENRSSLFIRSVNLSHVGHYSVDVSNSIGSVQTEPVRLALASEAAASPRFVWAQRFTPSNVNWIHATALDDDGNHYITGQFSGAFDIGSTTVRSSGQADFFLAKLDPAGVPLWAISAGEKGTLTGKKMTLSSRGHLYVLGDLQGAVSFGTNRLAGIHSFLAKFDRDGKLLWGRSVGHSLTKGVAGAATEDQVLATGTRSVPVNERFDTMVYIARHGPNGELLWSQDYPARANALVAGVASDAQGNSYLAGSFSGEIQFGSTQLLTSSFWDLFLVKLDPRGGILWAQTTAGLPMEHQGSAGLAVDALGNSYLVGHYSRQIRFGNLQLIHQGHEDIFLAKFSPQGRSLWAVSLGTSLRDDPGGVALDRDGHPYVISLFSAAFESGRMTGDLFISRYTSQGHWVWTKPVGGSGGRPAHHVAVNSAGEIGIAGVYDRSIIFDEFDFSSFARATPAGYAARLSDPAGNRPPLLGWEATAGSLRLFWTAGRRHYILQESLSWPPRWVDLSPAPSQMEERFEVRLPLGGDSRYFRLRRP